MDHQARVSLRNYLRTRDPKHAVDFAESVLRSAGEPDARGLQRITGAWLEQVPGIGYQRSRQLLTRAIMGNALSVDRFFEVVTPTTAGQVVGQAAALSLGRHAAENGANLTSVWKEHLRAHDVRSQRAAAN